MHTCFFPSFSMIFWSENKLNSSYRDDEEFLTGCVRKPANLRTQRAEKGEQDFVEIQKKTPV